VDLYTEEEIGEGFVYVPGGVAILGGDAEAYSTLPRQEVNVPSFAIAKFPVTFREYCAFLDDLERTDPALALKRAPNDRGSEGMAVRRGADHRWEPVHAIIEGEARKLFPIEKGHLWNLPIALIDWFDAVAYCAWSSQRGPIHARLPSDVEWEKAGRGVDGRVYPWGDRFDPTFCHMRDSRSFAPQPEPVGSFAFDESPYGVRDVAGGMRQWVGDIAGGQSYEVLSTEPEPATGAERGDSGFRCVRGGSWNTDARWARVASRSPIQNALLRGIGTGFRTAKALPARS
jgi:serine/threonine-protein kinase